MSISVSSNEVVQLSEEKNHTYTDTREKGEQLIFNSVELLFVCESQNPRRSFIALHGFCRVCYWGFVLNFTRKTNETNNNFDDVRLFILFNLL